MCVYEREKGNERVLCMCLFVLCMTLCVCMRTCVCVYDTVCVHVCVPLVEYRGQKRQSVPCSIISIMLYFSLAWSLTVPGTNLATNKPQWSSNLCFLLISLSSWSSRHLHKNGWSSICIPKLWMHIFLLVLQACLPTESAPLSPILLK